MKRVEKAAAIQRKLAELYPDPPVPLDHSDAFTLLVAVLLSAQTTDVRVNLVTPALFARAPDAAALARLEVSEILELIKTCGLAPSKAKHLSQLAVILRDRYDGTVPRTFVELEALPGVGHKTASVVMAQAFGEPAFPVDTHIHRLAERWGLSDGSSVARTERDLKRLFPQSAWNVLHLQMIYFGREFCPALRHDMRTCPICSWAASKRLVRASGSAAQRGARKGRDTVSRPRSTEST